MSKIPIASPSTALVYAACLFFSACATAPQIPSLAELLSRNTGQDGGACLHTSDVRRYSVYNDEFIFIDGSLGSYIVTANPGCQDLSTTPSLSFEGRSTRICGAGMGKITTRAHQCTIREIFKFEGREAAFAAFENAVEQERAMTAQSADAQK
jgi:hypothetical protein